MPLSGVVCPDEGKCPADILSITVAEARRLHRYTPPRNRVRAPLRCRTVRSVTRILAPGSSREDTAPGKHLHPRIFRSSVFVYIQKASLYLFRQPKKPRLSPNNLYPGRKQSGLLQCFFCSQGGKRPWKILRSL